MPAMTRKNLTRRQVLQHGASIGAGLIGLNACNTPTNNPNPQPNPPPAPSPGQKRLLEPTDIAFLGAFRLPQSVGGGDAAYGKGLAMRFVGTETRFFSTILSNQTPGLTDNVFEVCAPGLSLTAPYPMADVVHFWGDVCNNKRLLDPAPNGAPRGSGVYGLYWDTTDSRLYWSYGDGYNTVSARDPSFGFSTLNESTGKANAVGAWRTTNRSCKMAMGGILEIPQWFANQYCDGRRLGAGFGGYFSIAAQGPVSAGPALCAFNPSGLNATNHGSGLPVTDLVAYPFHANAYGPPDRAHRDTDYRTEFDGWNPKNGVGYWSWTDWLWQAAVWVDTPSVHGLLYFPILGNGRTWYETSTLHAERASHWWYVYDPADLARVAQGKLEPWQAQAARTWKHEYPGIQYPLPGWSDEPAQMIVGSTWDATAKRVYIAVRHAWKGNDPRETGTVVYAYQIKT
jgi:hypothetical protein